MAKTKPKSSKERSAKIYREFTRVRFSKYKLQFPRMRQSEVIAKIIKQWQAMDQNAKQQMAQEFIQKSGKGFLEDTPPSSDKKDSKQKKDDRKQSQPMSSSARQAKSLPSVPKKKKKPSPKMRVFVQKTQEKGADDDYKRKSSEGSKSPGKKSTPDKKQSSSSRLGIKNTSKGSKKISKTPTLSNKEKGKNDEYVNFYKYYHDRLRVEHPRWSTAQITTIIKLLWKKRNLTSERRRKGTTSKGLSGRQLYNRTKQSQGYLKEQIKLFWKALPHESKKYWQIKGQGKPNRSKKDSGRFVRKVLNAGVNKQQTSASEPQNPTAWMNRPIH